MTHSICGKPIDQWDIDFKLVCFEMYSTFCTAFTPKDEVPYYDSVMKFTLDSKQRTGLTWTVFIGYHKDPEELSYGGCHFSARLSLDSRETKTGHFFSLFPEEFLRMDAAKIQDIIKQLGEKENRDSHKFIDNIMGIPLTRLFHFISGGSTMLCSHCRRSFELDSYRHRYYGLPSQDDDYDEHGSVDRERLRVYGFQCQDCGDFSYPSTWKHQTCTITTEEACQCGGPLSRDYPIFCPHCHYNKVADWDRKPYLSLIDKST